VNPPTGVVIRDHAFTLDIFDRISGSFSVSRPRVSVLAGEDAARFRALFRRDRPGGQPQAKTRTQTMATVETPGKARRIGKRTGIKQVGDAMLPDPVEFVQMLESHKAVTDTGTLFCEQEGAEVPLEFAEAAGVEIV
jgi:hypothetical protein